MKSIPVVRFSYNIILDSPSSVGINTFVLVIICATSTCEATTRIKRMGHVFDDLIDCKRILREAVMVACAGAGDHGSPAVAALHWHDKAPLWHQGIR